MIAATLKPGLHVNLNLLDTFLLVAELGSFTAAAARSGRSTSAVSSQIKQLEEQLKVLLFVRTTRTVGLTDSGKLLAEAAGKGIAEIRDGIFRVYDASEAAMRRVVIGCSNTLSWEIAPALLAANRTRDSDMRVEVLEMPTSQMIEPLLAGDMAFGVGAADIASDAIDYETLALDPLVAIIPRHMRQSRLESITLPELSSLGIILPFPSITRNLLEAEFTRLRIVPRVTHDSANFHSTLAMVASGHGVAVVSDLGSRKYGDHGYSRIPLAGSAISIPWSLLKAKQRNLTKAEASLLDVIRRHALDRWHGKANCNHHV